MTKVNFRTNVLLKSIIGKDLITDDNIAVLELVKNSFDAGSNRVLINFHNLQKLHDDEDNLYDINASRIIIADTGIGMSEYDLINKWLNIAYSEKKVKREEYGRILAGNKGVGRFSCDRLGRYLTIYTRKKGQGYIKLFIDWKWFEQDGVIDLNIQDIPLEIEHCSDQSFKQDSGTEPFEEGTFLIISNLRERWNYGKILSLKRQLERLINPNQSFKSSSFEIIIDAPEYIKENDDRVDYEKIIGPVRNRIFDNLNFRTTSIESTISEDGTFITTTLQDRGNEIFKLIEANSFGLLKGINITIYYLNPYSKAYFTKQTGIRSNNFGSIFLFINGFRIPPYGDEGDDWLGMENRKGQGYNRFLGTREVVGRIEITDQEERFKIISSRSGIVSNDTFLQLTKSDFPFGYYYKTFRRLERFVVEGIRWDSTAENEKKIEKEILNNPDWTVSDERYIEDSLTRNKRIIELIRNIIDTRRDDLVSLNVNESFVSTLIDEQTIKVQQELESIAEQLKAKNLSPTEIITFLERINISKQELNSFANIISPYSTNKLENIYSDLEKKVRELTLEKERLEALLKVEAEKREKAEGKAKIAEEGRLKAETELIAEKQKSTYLLATRRTLSQDADGMVHTLKHNSTEIRDGINNLIDDIISHSYTEASLLVHLANIKGYSERSLKLAEIATRSDFKSDIDDRDIDIVKYIMQYVEIYKETFSNDGLEAEYITNDATFVKSTSILNLSIVLDNLLSNSVKWDATEIKFTFKLKHENTLSVLVSDNGIGLSSKFINNPEQIFELGVGDSPPHFIGGSGIGLYYSKSLLAEMNATIQFVGNNVDLRGICFELIFM